MIICPNCNGENADHSAHCGHCGHQLTEGGKKTMFGMAALDSSQIAKAAEEAKAARAGALPGPPSLNLPKPGGAAGDDDPYAKTEMMPSVQAAALGDAPAAGAPASEPAPAPAPDPFADDFAALEAQYGDEPPVDPAPMGAAPGMGGPSMGGPPMGGPPAGAAPSGPSSFGPPPGGGAMTQPPIDALDKPEKSKAPLIIIGVLALFGVMGCIGSVAAYFVMGT